MQSIGVYVFRRQLAWAGHVSRMGFERISRKLISSWVGGNRSACGVEMTYGRAMGKALSYANLYGGKWRDIAQDRSTWAAMIKNLC